MKNTSTTLDTLGHIDFLCNLMCLMWLKISPVIRGDQYNPCHQRAIANIYRDYIAGKYNRLYKGKACLCLTFCYEGFLIQLHIFFLWIILPYKLGIITLFNPKFTCKNYSRRGIWRKKSIELFLTKFCISSFDRDG